MSESAPTPSMPLENSPRTKSEVVNQLKEKALFLRNEIDTSRLRSEEDISLAVSLGNSALGLVEDAEGGMSPRYEDFFKDLEAAKALDYDLSFSSTIDKIKNLVEELKTLEE